MRRFLILALVVCLCGAIATSCSDDILKTDEPVAENVWFEIELDKTYGLMDFVENTLLPQAEGSLDNITMQLVKAQLAMMEQTIKSKNNLGIAEELGFRKVHFRYNSKGVNGEPLKLSSAVQWLGYTKNGEWYDLSPMNMVLMEHYTIASDKESPTGGFPLESFVAGNTLLIMPDYIGYGYTRELVHPYLNHQVHAINSADAIPAGYAVFDSLAQSGMSESWKLILAGASQGAANALAVHKYMDTENKDFAAKWRFRFSTIACGPYNPALTLDKYFEWGKSSNPVLFPMVIKGMIASYPDILGKYKEEDFYSENYLKYKDGMDRILSQKIYPTSRINEVFFAMIKVTADPALAPDEISLSDILSPAMLDRNSQLSKDFYSCLQKNDLTKGWTPSHSINLYYSKGDRVVPYENSMALIDSFGASKNVSGEENAAGLDHTAACAMWMAKLLASSAQNGY